MGSQQMLRRRIRWKPVFHTRALPKDEAAISEKIKDEQHLPNASVPCQAHLGQVSEVQTTQDVTSGCRTQAMPRATAIRACHIGVGFQS